MNDDELNLNEFLQHYLNIFKIYNAGDYERENLVLVAGEDCYLDDYILFQMEYNSDTDLPDMPLHRNTRNNAVLMLDEF